MVIRMKKTIAASLYLALAVFLGCAGSGSHHNTLSQPSKSETTLVADADSFETEINALTSAEIDSLFIETEQLLDSLSTPITEFGYFPGLETDLPDISDSLAAVTEAALPPPTGDEIFDYPVVVNRRVLSLVDFYQGKAKNTFNRSLKRSGRYLAMARRIFKEEGVPQDLTFLAHIESGFRHNARSRVKATGLWQFMRGTAREWGLRCDAYVDERLDPEKSTRASAQYLRFLYERYDDWYLALAAYNAGPGKVDRAIRRSGYKDFWEIGQTRFLVTETRNFVPAILAVTILAKSPGAYGYTEETDPPLEYDVVAVDTPTDLRVVSECTRVPLNELQDLNPALLLLQTPVGAPSFDIRVPKGVGNLFAREIEKIAPQDRLVFVRHKVKSGETLGLLAQRYGTTVRAIQQANRMGKRTMINIGKTLLIPSQSADGQFLASLDRSQATDHKVRSGDYLSKIAANYGVTVAALQQANDLKDPSKIYVGQKLIVPAAPSNRRKNEPTRSAPTTTRPSVAEETSNSATDSHESYSNSPSIAMRASNNATTLGRVPTTAHLVAQAREEIKRDREENPEKYAPRTYSVRNGDTLSEIAQRHHVRLSHLRRWNNLSGSRIHPGQKLIVKNPSLGGDDSTPKRANKLHVVKSGDSLWLIARHYGVKVRDLISRNGLRSNGTIYPGQKLKIY
jgi:peptidoglycan lytic transglycosylase D